jgi:hypothetical protein
MTHTNGSEKRQPIEVLCALTLSPGTAGDAVRYVESLTPEQRQGFLELADSNHVVLRALAPVIRGSSDPEVVSWATDAVAAEHGRIQRALKYLKEICDELEAAGCAVTVMKSLDHWPDLGNDLDLYSTADEAAVADVMMSKFDAHVEPRSWGDRLASKWNFKVPGLREAIEVHVQRLGQVGEHIAMARRFVTRRVPRQVGSYTFQVPAPEERILVATLQRMYRHFYFRVCDVVNGASLVESGTIDYAELQRAATRGGIWPGVATYLLIVSDYVKRYRGTGLALPTEVTAAALFGGEKIQIRGRFLRVPVMPEGANLYTRQVTAAALNGDVPATLRLSLLPYLASAAAIAYKITGSDKGIW